MIKLYISPTTLNSIIDILKEVSESENKQAPDAKVALLVIREQLDERI